MIVLGNERELVRVESWEDITSRPGFDGNLDPANHELASIIGQYGFRDRVPCGLSNCHTPHQRGFIVVTKDGRETNIGKDCGKHYFGVDFETLSAKFTLDMREKDYRERLSLLSLRVDDVWAQVSSIRDGPFGADWIHKQLSALQSSKYVPSRIVGRLSLMKKNADARVVREREATESEIDAREQSERRRLERPQYVQEVVGTLAGIEALYSENDMRQLLVIELGEPLKAFSVLDIDSMTFEQLARWSKWAGVVDATLDRAVAAAQSGRLLLTQANLIQLSDATNLTSDEHRQFEGYLRLLPKN